MHCPHCSTIIHFHGEHHVYRMTGNSGSPSGYELTEGFCPSCNQLIVHMSIGEYRWIEDQGEITNVVEEQFLYPKFLKRALDAAIPQKYGQMFNEAVAVLSASPRASAALSRRLLQQLLREEFKIVLGENANLDLELKEFYKLPEVPGHIKNVVDEIRQIGNWAAHPLKYKSTGDIVDVEPQEAEWLLDILEDILDMRFVQPNVEKERLAKYDQKRKDIRR